MIQSKRRVDLVMEIISHDLRCRGEIVNQNMARTVNAVVQSRRMRSQIHFRLERMRKSLCEYHEFYQESAIGTPGLLFDGRLTKIQQIAFEYRKSAAASFGASIPHRTNGSTVIFLHSNFHSEGINYGSCAHHATTLRY